MIFTNEALGHVLVELAVVFLALFGFWGAWLWAMREIDRRFIRPPQKPRPPCTHRFVRLVVSMDYRGTELSRGLVCADCLKPVPVPLKSGKETLQ